ncbi:MAG: ornithine carbamoyltransferase, partial [Planctomycetota bacterium]
MSMHLATESIHFLQVTDHDAEFVTRVLDRAEELRSDPQPVLAGKSLAMVFEKPSLRTRVSFEVAMTRLGGHEINLQPQDIGLNTREPARDVARVLSGMCEVIMARVFDHATLVDLAEAADVPVINGLSDLAHPCQALADALTIRDHVRDVEARQVVY